MQEVVFEHITANRAILNGMEQHYEHVSALNEMLAVLRERQSSWKLTDEERKHTRKGIKALEAARDALSVQIYA